MTANGDEPLLSARHVVQEFVVRGHGGVKGGVVQAVSDVSFDVRAGETLGVVGETGSGKSTLARSVLQAPRPKSGSVRFQGTDLVGLKGRRLLEARRSLQMVFQDPFGSLDPKWRVFDLVEEPLVAYGVGTREERRQRVREVLDTVGMDPDVYGRRRPRQLSGGQAQRVAIARALTLDPALIICDEAVSSLDVLIQAQVLNLFERLRAELGLSYLFIAHDLALVKQVSDRVAVMYLGRLCELGPAEALYREPFHPYTVALLASIPSPDPDAPRAQANAAISGDPPSPIDPPSGCRFRTRCPRAQERCAVDVPEMRELAPDHAVACHFPVERRRPWRRDGGRASGLPDRRPCAQVPAARGAARPAGRAAARGRRLRPRDLGLLARQARGRRRGPRRRRPGPLPLTTRAELGAEQAEHPPFGDYTCSPRETWMGVFTTSGTSGRKLKRVVSWRDWRLMIGLLHRNPAPPPGEIFMLLGPVDGLLGPSVGVEAARQRGSIPVLAGMWDTRTKVQAIAELRPGVIAGAASYIVHLSEVAAEMGVDLSACGLRAVTSFGEPGAAIEATHATIGERFGVEQIVDGYGLTEVWPLGGNCPQSRALHIPEDVVAVESIDPESGAPVAEGEPGEIVLTTLVGDSHPLLRYRTRDVGRLIVGEPCACGSTFARIERIEGRTDDMIWYRGANFFPSAVEEIVRRQEGLSPEYRIVLDDGPRGLPVVTIQVEGDTRLRARVRESLRGGLGVNPELEVLAPGTLPRAEQGKAKRVLDRRAGAATHAGGAR